MDVKTLEIRDEGTMIPALAIRLYPGCERDRYLIARAGYGPEPENQSRYVLLCKLTGGESQNDPYKWHNAGRTMREAHIEISRNWALYPSGAVLDVQFVLGERPDAKQSEDCIAEPVRNEAY